MRDPKRIEKVLATISRVWYRVPDWRLEQLLYNATRQTDPFYIEDEQLIKQLERMEKKIINKETK